MASKAAKIFKLEGTNREYSPIIQMFRTVLLGRVANNPLRFPNEVCEHPGPEANIPPGPSHKLSGNYYFTRDGRREVTFPSLIADETKAKAIASGEGTTEDAGTAVATRQKSKTPGTLYRYSE